MYNNLKNKMSKSQKSFKRKQISSIIKENTISNLNELNKAILNVINVDEEFKMTILDLNS